MKLTYEELEEKVKVLEKKAALVDSLEKEISNNNQFLDKLLNTIPNPVFYKDIDGIYQKANDAFARVILGIEKEEIIGKSLYDLPERIPTQLAQRYYAKDNELFDNPGTQIYESEVKCSNGEIRTFYFYKATVEDENKSVMGLVGVMLDVTELKQSQERLNERNELLAKLSYKDALTGIYNRRKFDEIFPSKISSFSLHNGVLNFVIIDVDNFKLYNDTYGHAKGDKVLKVIAGSIKNRLSRSNDYFFRLGGEEFGLFFESSSYEKALSFIESIREDIEALNIEHEKNSEYKKVTISCGLASINSLEIESKEVYEEADRLLYLAKNQGKNQVCSKIV